MPTYEYECTQCGTTFERFQSMKDEPIKDCPDAQCGGRGTVRRLISSGGGLIFKGSGFYVTDYKKGNVGAQGHSSAKKESADTPCASCPKEGCPAKDA